MNAIIFANKKRDNYKSFHFPKKNPFLWLNVHLIELIENIFFKK